MNRDKDLNYQNRAEDKYNMACQIRIWAGWNHGDANSYGSEVHLREMTMPELTKIYIAEEKEITSNIYF